MLLAPTEYEDDEDGLHFCRYCFGNIAVGRWAIGYHSCLSCGAREASKVKHTIVPVPKSNYVYAHTINDVISPYSHKGNR